MRRVFSGVQPTGEIHIGNYLGAIRNFVKLQEEAECLFCVVNLHAITVPQDPALLKQKTLEVATLYFAAGLDPNKCIVFAQSDVSAHTELSWMLECNSYFGELSRMTQFKDKSHGKDNVSTGLFTYPVLMAADILLYQTDLVPVGQDQKQHIELTRDVAQRFNQRFGATFKVPEPMIGEVGAKIMALDDPYKKMSKSADSPNNRINLMDDPKTVKKKIGRAVTDSGSEVRYSVAEKPGIANLMSIYSVLSGDSIAQIEARYEGRGYGAFKGDLTDIINADLAKIQSRYKELQESGQVLDFLETGAAKARKIADQTMTIVKERMGFTLR
ncbi:MAG TPA: tryptophan--tRNA ligase [Candidatus Deferrimicrobium sp.]|nr:tryptophan--tRNA ligase [Candidatus Deferrimicrobium sp.]